jgi:hypothetical protein
MIVQFARKFIIQGRTCPIFEQSAFAAASNFCLAG